MDELYDDRWQELWSQVCEAFTEEAGHEPPPSLEFWEVTLLYRLVLADFDRPTVRRAKRQLLSNATGSNSLAQLKQELQRTVQSLWRQEDAEEALAEAVELERSGQWDEAREAYAKGVFLGPSQPLQRAAAQSNNKRLPFFVVCVVVVAAFCSHREGKSIHRGRLSHIPCALN